MLRVIKVWTIALAAVLALASGCKKVPKNITPIPGYSTSATTNVTAVPGDQTGGVGRPVGGRPQNLRDTGGQFTDSGISSKPIVSTKPFESVQTQLDPRLPGLQDAETLKADTVYFDYDKSAIRASERAKVASVADYLKAHPEKTLIVEGHCDERGTDEYNRALGERRALSVREALISQGVSSDRITTTSWGKDRPAEIGHDEAAWSKNRRGAFVLVSPSGSLQ